jgi:hypothetical protein
MPGFIPGIAGMFGTGAVRAMTRGSHFPPPQSNTRGAQDGCLIALGTRTKRFAIIDITHRVVREIALLAHLEHAIDDGCGVPAAKEDADLALGRQRLPVAPHGRAGQFFGGGRVKGHGADVARVHPFIEQVHRLALARPAHAGDEDDHRKVAPLGKLHLRFEQRRAQLRLHLLVFALGKFVSDFCRFKQAHGVAPWWGCWVSWGCVLNTGLT